MIFRFTVLGRNVELWLGMCRRDRALRKGLRGGYGVTRHGLPSGDHDLTVACGETLSSAALPRRHDERLMT